MKNLFYNGTIILVIILITSCGQTEKKKTTDSLENVKQRQQDIEYVKACNKADSLKREDKKMDSLLETMEHKK